MATYKISQLTAVTSIAGTEELEVNQAGTSKKATRTQLVAGLVSAGAVTTSGLTITADRILGRTTAGTGAIEELLSVPVSLGGTGATSAASARTNLGLGTAATMAGPTGTIVGTSDSQTLTNKTLTDPTLADSSLIRAMLKDSGYVYYNSNTTNSLDYTNGSHQRWAPSGTVTLSISNWPPSGNLGELLIEGINLGAATITWPTINWITSNGSTTTTFSSNGVTLQTSGTDWVVLWTRDAGTTVYGKIIR